MPLAEARGRQCDSTKNPEKLQRPFKVKEIDVDADANAETQFKAHQRVRMKKNQAMRKYLTTTLLLGCAVLSVAARESAESDNDENAHLSYRIPDGAERFASESTRERDVVEYHYFAKGKKRERSEMLAVERFYKKTRIESELFKDGKKHGIQQEWYNDGKPKSEVPRKNGLIHGWCKHWDEGGNLVGQYRITNGVGTRRIYHLNGQLRNEIEIPKRVPDGDGWFGPAGCIVPDARAQTSIVCNCERRCALSVSMSTNGQVQSLGWNMHGRPTRSLGFHATGSLSFIAWFPGPAIRFREDGSVEERIWRVRLADVSESEYARRAETNPSLPPYYPDASHYKQFVDDEVKAIIEKYQKLPRVKFPLEFDRDGNPVPLSSPAE